VPALALVGICLLLILKPWNVEVQTTDEARAGGNVLAVIQIQNIVNPDDPERLGYIATNLLITDLSESEHLQKVTSQRIHDILKLLGREGDETVHPDIASEVAAEARAKWMLSGSILQIEPHFVITTQLMEVSTGNVLGSQRVVGNSDDDIFALVDKMTIAIKEDLPLPQQALTEWDPPVAQVTTSSQEAYRYYLEANEYMLKLYYEEAVFSFEKALEYDSTLAQAYSGLAVVYQDTAYMVKALQYIDNVNQLDRLYILATAARLRGDPSTAIEQYENIIDRYPDEKWAYCMLGIELAMQGNLDTSIYYFKEAIRVDALFKHAYNWLAYIYDDLDLIDSAIAALDEYLALAPGEANPYDSRGDILAGHGRIDEAIESFEKAIEIKPDFLASHTSLGYMYLFKGDYERADSYFRESVAISNLTTRPDGRLRLALVPLRRGKFERALQILHDGIVADELEIKRPAQVLGYHMKFLLRAAIYAERGDFELAAAEEEEYLRRNAEDTASKPLAFPSHYIWHLAESGRLSEAREECEKWRSRLEKAGAPMEEYQRALGFLARAEGNLEVALEHFEQAKGTTQDFAARFVLAETYLQAGRTDDAIKSFGDLLVPYTSNRAIWGHWSVKIHYYLGVGFEQEGRTAEAAAQFRQFLDIWREADPGLSLVEDARKRLSDIQSLP
jgi:tetratricopeptide (TPR) repeat protein